jgi:glycosyltransferase involved in cell wall biosynthesis
MWPDSNHFHRPTRVTSVIASLTAGGIGPVCRYAAEGMAKMKHWRVTLLSLHDPAGEFDDEASGLKVVCLGIDGNCARLFLQWLAANPQDVIITSDVSRIEQAYRFLPSTSLHVVQIHDSGRRYRDVAGRHSPWIDGVTCVGQHIEAPLQRSLDAVGFHGLLRTIHNGANFPPIPYRSAHNGPLRLLFVGRVEALKGVFDFVPLLQRIRKLGVPVTLNLVGGENEALRRQFLRQGLADLVTWTGRVPHDQCYDIAANSDIFLMTSRKESFGMVTIEAMSMGCVPIAYDIRSGSTEIIEHEKSGYLVPLGDIRTLANHICHLHHDRVRLASLSAEAIKRARTHFNAETMAQNMAAFLIDVMAHATIHPAKREPGLPPETPLIFKQPSRGYQRLPQELREWIRNRVHANPKLSHWLLSR